MGLSGAQTLTASPLSIGGATISYSNIQKLGFADGSVSIGSMPVLPSGAPMGLVAAGTAAISLPNSTTMGSLDITDTATVSLLANGQHYIQIGTTAFPANTSSVNIALPASGFTGLDVWDNGLVVQCADATTRDSVVTQLFTLIGNSRGTNPLTPWTHAGIRSSTAKTDNPKITTVGVRNNQPVIGTAPFKSTFKGDALPDRFSALAGYTFNGDTDLNGVLNGTDYTNILNGYAGHKTGWANGDFDYNGVINGSDYTVLNAAYNARNSIHAGQIAMVKVAAPAAAAAATASPFSTKLLAGGQIPMARVVAPAAAAAATASPLFSTTPLTATAKVTKPHRKCIYHRASVRRAKV